jgi:hypothetical protein
MDKYGSRVLEAIWASADIAFKEFIADSLLGEEQQISSNMYGKIVVRKGLHCITCLSLSPSFFLYR